VGKFIEKAGIITVVLVTFFLLAAVGGLVVVVSRPDTLSFQDYLTLMTGLAGALGLLGIGRGVKAAGKHIATGRPLEVGTGGIRVGERVAVHRFEDRGDGQSGNTNPAHVHLGISDESVALANQMAAPSPVSDLALAGEVVHPQSTYEVYFDSAGRPTEFHGAAPETVAQEHLVAGHVVSARDRALGKMIEHFGGEWGVRVVWEARGAGIPVSLLCAFLTQETGFRNVFGHDPTIYVGAGAVTKTKYLAYKAARGHSHMQGVGPGQLTYWSYQDEADRLGGCWVPEHNIHVAAHLVASLIHQYGESVGIERFNGSGPAARAYASSVLSLARLWHSRLSRV
jgi:hypothetical protein